MTAPVPLEMTRPTPISRIGPRGLAVDVVANEDELRAIASRVLIPDVASMSCRFHLTRRADDPAVVDVVGELVASVVQVCVVTLEPFEAPLQERFRLCFVPVGRALANDDDPDSADEIAYEGVMIDLGEAAVEQLALALEPFPRRPDATLPDLGDDELGGAFSSLSVLRRST